jgi:hypothetical protein
MRISSSVLAALMAIVVAAPTLAAPAVRRDKVCPAKDDEGGSLRNQVIEGDKLNCQYDGAGGCVYFLGNGNFSSGSSTCPDAGVDATDPAAGKIVNGKITIDKGMVDAPMKDEKPPMKEEQPMMHEPPMQQEKPKEQPPMMHDPPMQQEKPKEQPPMMHDQPSPPPMMHDQPPPMMHEPPMQQEKPKEEPPMMHDKPPMAPPPPPPPMHEPPMQQEKPKEEPPMMHEPPMQQEKPKEEPPVMHEPPKQTPPPPPPPPPANKPLEDCLHQCKMAMPPSMMMGHMRR